MTELATSEIVVPALWDHQEQAVEAAVGQLAGGGRCQVVMACGTGKTRVGAEVSARVAVAGKVLVVVPTLELLAQTARAWAAVLGEGAGLIGAVCSEQAATVETGELRTEMRHLHAGVSTVPAEIAAWLQTPGRVTVLSTYQSLAMVSEACRLAGAGWDLAVIDEAHRAAGRTDRSWQAVNEDMRIPALRRMYMTATPRVMTSDRHEVVSMDDEGAFGPEVYRLSFAEAIGADLLADYRVAVIAVTDHEVAQRAADAGLILSAGGYAVPADMLAQQIALLKAAARWDLRRVITYHRRVERSRRFSATLLNAADLLPASERPAMIRAEHLDGDMPLWRRRDILRHLESPGGHLVAVSNARVLSEGVDVPDLDAVMFADPRDSGTDVVQAVGRALRKGSRPGKTATLIVPLMITGEEAAEAALEGSAFDMVWRVIRALRAHDERLADWLDATRVDATRGRPQDRGTAPLPRWLDVSGIPVTAAFAGALQIRMLHTTTSRFLDGYAHAVAYHAEHGHLRVPAGHTAPGGFPLGQWVSWQRGIRQAGRMNPDHETKLDALGIVWDIFDARWWEALSRAAAYHAEHGTVTIPADYTEPDGFQLREWLGAQRRKHRNGHLTGEQVQALDALGMRWEPVAEARWQAGITAAREFRAKHGHLNIPTHHPRTPSGLDLEGWVQRRRLEYRNGELAPDRVAELEALGISWNPYDDAWQEGLAALPQYRDEFGVVRIPRAARTASGMRLDSWASNRRAERRNGTLSADRIKALDAAGFVWDPHEQDWRDGLADCQTYYARHGHLNVPKNTPGQRLTSLNSWIERRRREHRNGQLPADKVAALTACGMDWDGARGASRARAHAALRAYRAEHGHLDIPGTYVTSDGLRLGAWIANKKTTHRRGGQIHPETLAVLRECGAPWLDAAPAMR